jgi:hypothetical protein
MKRLLGYIAVALLAIGAFEPFYVRIFLADRARLGASLRELPYTKAPGLRRFYAEVAARTPPGARIAIASRWTQWEGGYEYVYARALYPLAGREVVALTGPHPSDVNAADYVAAYRSEPALPGFVTVWRSADGALLRRMP